MYGSCSSREVYDAVYVCVYAVRCVGSLLMSTRTSIRGQSGSYYRSLVSVAYTDVSGSLGLLYYRFILPVKGASILGFTILLRPLLLLLLVLIQRDNGREL